MNVRRHQVSPLCIEQLARQEAAVQRERGVLETLFSTETGDLPAKMPEDLILTLMSLLERPVSASGNASSTS